VAEIPMDSRRAVSRHATPAEHLRLATHFSLTGSQLL
jgi:hypothetical protein